MIARLLDDPPHVLATGGGAFIDDETRALIDAKAISVWLKADLEVLARRVGAQGQPPAAGAARTRWKCCGPTPWPATTAYAEAD